MSALPKAQFRYRRMEAVDLPVVAALEASLYAFPWSIGNFRDSVNAGYDCWVACADGRRDPGPLDVPQDWNRRAARLRWAELLRHIYEVDPLRCPACGAEMRIIAVIMEPKVIDRILAHLRRKGRDPRAGPWRSLEGDAPPIAA